MFRDNEHGISLYTMLAAVVVLGVMGSVLVTQFTGSGSRAQAALALAENTNRAMHRFHLDTGCWPVRTQALFDKTFANNHNTCDQALGNRWQGPYLRPITTNDVGTAQITAISPGAILSMQPFNPSAYAGSQTPIYVKLGGMPSSISQDAREHCPACVFLPNAKPAGPWLLVPVNPGRQG